MPQNPPNNPTPRQSKEALLEAAQAAIADQRSRPPSGYRPPPGPGIGRRIFRTSLVVLMVTGAGLLAARPAWLAGPTMPVESPEIRTASATLSLVDAISKIESHLMAQGRLPSRLTDIGVPNTGIRYRVLDSTAFEVSLATPDTTVVLRSTDSIRVKTIDAIRVLQGRA